LTIRRALTLALPLCAAAVLPGRAAAQSFVPQPQQYMLTTDASDGRALWVQPAGLARRHEASISALVTADRAAGGTRIGQYGATLASGVLAFGWQHDRFSDTVAMNAFVVGLAAGTPVVSLGADRRWYSGTNTKDGSWDVGGRYQPAPALELSLVWRDIGSPVVVGDTIFATLVPGASVSLFGGAVHAGADWEIVTRGWNSSAVRAGVTVPLPAHFGLSLRGELTGNFSARGLALAVTWNGAAARVTGFGSSVRAPDLDRAGLWGAAVSDPARPRRRFGR
jgi:hypothetical protein